MFHIYGQGYELILPQSSATEVRPFRPDKSLANEVARPKGSESVASFDFHFAYLRYFRVLVFEPFFVLTGRG